MGFFGKFNPKNWNLGKGDDTSKTTKYLWELQNDNSYQTHITNRNIFISVQKTDYSRNATESTGNATSFHPYTTDIIVGKTIPLNPSNSIASLFFDDKKLVYGEGTEKDVTLDRDSTIRFEEDIEKAFKHLSKVAGIKKDEFKYFFKNSNLSEEIKDFAKKIL